MRIALAQINSTLGDFKENAEKILDFISRAKDRHCDIVLFPEASLFGYHPVDLLERKSIVEEQEKYISYLQKKMPEEIIALVGAIVKNPKKRGKPYFNAAVLLKKTGATKVFAKELLPTYDVFDEGRHIQPGDLAKNRFKLKGKNVLVTICEDIWGWEGALEGGHSNYSSNPLKKLKAKDVDLVLNLSASPYTDTKMKGRQLVAAKTVQHFKAPIVYVNMVGAQDELIYDGGSFALDKKGKFLARCARFEEDINVVDFDEQVGGERPWVKDVNEQRRQALSLGIRDFAEKIGISEVHLGLSGGIDSAVVACLAADALGPMKVTLIAMPGPFNAPESLSLAKKLAKNLGTNWHEIPIAGAYDNLLTSFETELGKSEFSVTNENIQARIRGTFLMAFSNRNNSLLLNTSNKSEFSMGYTTLYGDMCGGLCPIGDLLKTEVYDLAKHYNSEGEVIPDKIITRPPSAELRPNQTDQDTLPPYEKLDKSVEKMVEKQGAARGPLEKRILRSLISSEFKRWQAAPILKVSNHAFGRGRRLPIAHKAYF